MNGLRPLRLDQRHFLCEGLRRMGPGMPLWQDFPAIMERSPLQIPLRRPEWTTPEASGWVPRT